MTSGADRGDFAGGLGADDQRQLALGKGHAAPAPDVDVIEPDRLDADLHLAWARRRRRRDFEQFDLAVGDKRERAHRPRGGAARALVRGVLPIRRRSRRLPRQHQRDILAAEAERIGDGARMRGVARHIRHHVERDRGIGHAVIDGRRDALVLQRQQGESPLRPRRPRTAYGRSSICWRRSECP